MGRVCGLNVTVCVAGLMHVAGRAALHLVMSVFAPASKLWWLQRPNVVRHGVAMGIALDGVEG